MRFVIVRKPGVAIDHDPLRVRFPSRGTYANRVLRNSATPPPLVVEFTFSTVRPDSAWRADRAAASNRSARAEPISGSSRSGVTAWTWTSCSFMTTPGRQALAIASASDALVGEPVAWHPGLVVRRLDIALFGRAVLFGQVRLAALRSAPPTQPTTHVLVRPALSADLHRAPSCQVASLDPGPNLAQGHAPRVLLEDEGDHQVDLIVGDLVVVYVDRLLLDPSRFDVAQGLRRPFDSLGNRVLEALGRG